MKIVADVLDNQLVDRHKQLMGKVDGLVMLIEDGRQPRITHITCGCAVLAPRLHGKLGARLVNLVARLRLAHPRPMRIPWSKVREVGIEIELALDANRTRAMAWEKWLKRNIVSRIPFSG